jgi:hypothetical protein
LVHPLSVSQSLTLLFSPVAEQFKKAFENAQDNNAKLAGVPSTAPPPYSEEEKHEETAESEDEAEENAPASSETKPSAEARHDSEKTGGE